MTNHYSEIFFLKNGKTISITNCEAKFAEQYEDFTAQIAKETTHTNQYEGRKLCLEEITKKWEIALSSTSQLFLGGFDQDRLIAQLAFRQLSPNHPWTKHIGEFGIMILQDYWSQGLGLKMIQIMENYAKKINISRLEARTRTRNLKGLNLYLNNGYEIEGTRKQAAFINGKFEDEYYISKILT